jgi:hypothetical protein
LVRLKIKIFFKIWALKVKELLNLAIYFEKALVIL